MKIVFFTTFYDKYLDAFEQKNKLEELSYKEIYDLLINDSFGGFGLYAINANLLGHDAEVLIANCKPLQKQWAKENNMSFNDMDWLFSIPIQQLKKIKPDVFFMGSMFQYFGSFLDEIKPYCKLLSAWTSCSFNADIQFNQFKLVLTSVPHLRDRFIAIDKVNSEVLLPGFDPRMFEKLERKITKNIDFSFIGGITGDHSQRIVALKQLAEKTNIQFYGYGFPQKRKYEWIKQYLKPNKFIQRYKGDAWGLDMFLKLGNSKITFNSHIDMAQDSAANMRMFEATGMRTLLLTDYKFNLNTIFEIDKEVVAYKTIPEAIDKVHYYLKCDKEREAIAEAGQLRTFKEYNYLNVTRKMLDLFEDNFKS